MRRTLGVLLALVAPTVVLAQTNTTGTLSPNTSVTQLQTPAPGATTTRGTATGATTTTTTTGATPPAPTATSPTTTTTSPTTTATATGAPRDAAIVICGQEFSTGTPQLLVFSASTSAGAPAIAPGASCAQALSDLFVAGFGVIDVLPFNQQLQYTLIR